MDYLKKKFLGLSIHKQIQTGIMTFSFCVCLLVFGVILLNIILLFELTSMDCNNLLEREEKIEIDATSLFFEIEILSAQEFSKIGIQQIRNMLTNYQRNRDFEQSYFKINYDKFLRSNKKNHSDCRVDDSSNRNCMALEEYNLNLNNLILSEYNLYKMRLSLTFPFIQATNYYRLINIINNNFLERINFYSYNFSVFITFPFNSSTSVFNQTDLENTMSTFTDLLQFYQTKNQSRLITNNGLYNQNMTNSKEVFRLNPILGYLNSSENPRIYGNNENLFLTVFSNKFNDFYDIKNLSKKESFDDIIATFLSPSVLDSSIRDSTLPLRGLKLLLTTFDKEQRIISGGDCFYFLKLYEIHNPKSFLNLKGDSINYFKGGRFNISSCFPYETGHNLIDSYFRLNTDDFDNLPIYNRKTNLPLINSAEDVIDVYGNDIKFKVFRSTIPSLYTKMYISSDFYYYSPNYLYLLKDTRILLYQKNELEYKFNGILFLILFVVLTFWSLNIIVISIILYSVTSSITTPINRIIELIISIGQTNKNDDERDLDKIEFTEDKDIDDLFQLCKNLVRGGFTEEVNKIQKFQFLSTAINNISYVKMNNIIIDEEKFENNLNKNAFYIFRYSSPPKRIFDNDNYSENSQNIIPNISEYNSNNSVSVKIKFNTEIIHEKELYNTTQHGNINTINPNLFKFKTRLESDIYSLILEFYNKLDKKKNSLYEIFEKAL